MSHNRNESTRAPIWGALFCFLLTSTTAIILFLIALVDWLGEVLRSQVAALLLLGGVLSLIAVLLYFSHIRRGVERLNGLMESLREFLQLATRFSNWTLERVSWIMAIIKKVV